MKNIILILSLVLVTIFVSAQKYAGIEIGSKGVKVAVVNVEDINVGKFSIVKNWTRNTAIARQISIDKTLGKQDIEETSNAVNEIYLQLQSEYKLDTAHIFIVGSSGVAMATNTADFGKRVFELTGKRMQFITAEQEGKLTTKGAVPVSRYESALVFDIGGGNTKGGYVLRDDAGHFYFYGISFDFGGVTLPERVNKTYAPKTFDQFAAGLNEFTQDTLTPLVIKSVFDNKPAAKRKTNIYAMGGGTWAFATLMFPTNKDNYMTFTYKDVVAYRNHILTDYDKWVETQRGLNEKGVNNVTDTYSREALLSTATILKETFDQIKDKENVNCFFARQGGVAWLIAYIVDDVRKNNQ